MKILILAAGYATRLYPLTKHWPKPLLLIKEKPILSHILRKTEKLTELQDIYVVTNGKYFHQFQDWASYAGFKRKIVILNDRTTSEKDRLGTIGDIHFAITNFDLNDDLLIIGGDNLFTFDLQHFLDFARSKKDDCSVGLYDIKDPALVRHYGVVSLGETRKVVDFKEKPLKSDSTLISMCLYYFPRKSLKSIGEYVKRKDCHDTSGDYIQWLYRKTDVWGYEFKGLWYDIGDIITFYHASVNFKD